MSLTRAQALTMLAGGVADDVAAYHALLALQDAQFDAAVRHRSAQLADLAGQIGAAVDQLEQRRQRRGALLAALLGPGARMGAAFALLAGASRIKLITDWAALEQMVPECKRRNQRNCDLLTEQYSIMQRVLHGEEQIYAPA